MLHQKKFTAAQPMKKEFEFSEEVSSGLNGFSLVLTNKRVFNNETQRHFDSIYVILNVHWVLSFLALLTLSSSIRLH